MPKHQTNIRETQIETSEGVGKSIERVVTVDDNAMPSPEDMAAYKNVDPDFVKFFMDTVKEESSQRHEERKAQIKMMGDNLHVDYRYNMWGMATAFFAFVVIAALTAIALCLDHVWFATVFSATTIVSIVSLFLHPGKRKG